MTSALFTADPTRLQEAGTDFGRYRRGSPALLAQPRSLAELQGIIREAKAAKLKITPRATGYSASGQSLSSRGLALDLRALGGVLGVTDDSIEVEGGVTWEAVVRASVPHGVMPPVLPLNLAISVGGLLSVGGVGSSAHHHGLVVANVDALTLVTADGEAVECNATRNERLFAAALGGLGRVGVIARAKLRLVSAPTSIKTLHLGFSTAGALLSAVERLRRDACLHLEGFCWAGHRGVETRAEGRRPFTRWSYALAVGFNAASRPAFDVATLGGTLLAEDEQGALEHALRYRARFELMHRTGAWAQHHPWAEYFVPASGAEEALEAMLASLPPWFGDGHRVMPVTWRHRCSLVSAPREDFVCMAALPAGVPAEVAAESSEAVGALDRLLLARGAKRYLAGHFGRWSDTDWRAHYGDLYAEWRAVKEAFDPEGVFGSVLLDEPGGSITR